VNAFIAEFCRNSEVTGFCFMTDFFCSLQVTCHRTPLDGSTMTWSPTMLVFDSYSYNANGLRTKEKPLDRRPRRPLTDVDIIRRILLYKGREVSPRDIVMNVNGRWKANDVTRIMLYLEEKGAGSFCKKNPHRKGVFAKKPVTEVSEILDMYGIQAEVYCERYERDRSLSGDPSVDSRVLQPSSITISTDVHTS